MVIQIILNDFILLNLSQREFLGGSVVMTSPSNTGVAGLIPDQEVKILHASWPKSQNMKQKQNVTNSIKTLKNGPL